MSPARRDCMQVHILFRNAATPTPYDNRKRNTMPDFIVKYRWYIIGAVILLGVVITTLYA